VAFAACHRGYEVSPAQNDVPRISTNVTLSRADLALKLKPLIKYLTYFNRLLRSVFLAALSDGATSQSTFRQVLLQITSYGIIVIDDQQDATILVNLFIPNQLIHVSGDVFARHREHLTVFTSSDTVHRYCCRLGVPPSLGAFDCIYSFRYCPPLLLPAASRQQ
jgi:hypothetical protein